MRREEIQFPDQCEWIDGCPKRATITLVGIVRFGGIGVEVALGNYCDEHETAARSHHAKGGAR